MSTISKNPTQFRFAYLDNVRSFVIFFVIAMHSAVTYSSYGRWYYIEGEPETFSSFEIITFAFYEIFIQAWFMGTLFFISAYLATKSLAKRGVTQFVKERMFRLGLPLLFYVFLIDPYIKFILIEQRTLTTIAYDYIHYLTSFTWVNSTGPFWFVETLLIFCILYAGIRKFFPIKKTLHTFNSKSIVFLVIITGIIAFLIRIVFPIVTVFHNFQLCYFGSYIVLFILGILIGENNLFENITKVQNIRWFSVTLITAPVLWAVIMILSGAIEGHTYHNGGFNWASFSFSLWESFVAIGFSIGIIAFFKKYVNINNKCTRLLAENSFGMYFFHAALLVMISLRLKPWIINPVLKFVAVSIITCIVCLIFTFLARKMKPVGILLK